VEVPAGDQGEKRSVLVVLEKDEEDDDGMGDAGGTSCCGSWSHPELLVIRHISTVKVSS
jgi:hypothetical protein